MIVGFFALQIIYFISKRMTNYKKINVERYFFTYTRATIYISYFAKYYNGLCAQYTLFKRTKINNKSKQHASVHKKIFWIGFPEMKQNTEMNMLVEKELNVRTVNDTVTNYANFDYGKC